MKLNSCSGVQVLPGALTDISNKGHDGETIKEAILDGVAAVEERAGGTKVIAVTTDAAADCRKGRRLAQRERPDIVYLDCFAHQV